jgi:hypothetical protein
MAGSISPARRHRLPFFNAGVSRVQLPFEVFKLKI